MLNELCVECRNYFLRDYRNPSAYIHEGTYTIQNGTIQDLPFLKTNQYYRIVGSTFNDGVWKYGDVTVTLGDETFDGVIWEMFVPPAFVALAAEIKQWTLDNAQTLASPYQSESFGGYSYSLKSGGSAGSADAGLTWQAQFASRLKPYRRLSVL